MSSELYLKVELEQKELDAIFNETEIAKRFDEAMKENKELISNQISAVRKAFVSLLEKDEELRSRVLDESNVTLETIEEGAKIFILNMAVIGVLYDFNFDVKQNILEILNSDDMMKRILRERVETHFLSITDWRYKEELHKLL